MLQLTSVLRFALLGLVTVWLVALARLVVAGRMPAVLPAAGRAVPRRAA